MELDIRFVVTTLCINFMLIHYANALAVIHNPNHPNKTGNEYLVVINTNNLDLSSSLFNGNSFDWDSFKQRLKDNHDIDISVKFDFGRFKAISIKTDRNLQPLLEDRDIEFIEPNIRFSLDGSSETSTVTNDINSEPKVCNKQSTGTSIWGLSRIDQRDRLERSLFRPADYTWSTDDDGTGVTVFVMDTGVFVDHSDIKGRAVHGFTSSSIASREDNSDNNGHGTHVAGKIGGKTYGVAKNANIVAVKVLDASGAGTTIDLVEGLQYIYKNYAETTSNGKFVVNLSLGAPGSAPTMERAVMQCVNQGIHMVVAAGNEYQDACLFTPARVEQVITVGSTTIKDELSSFSNYGPCVDILAPGSDIVSAWIGSATSTAKASGTSMACPHVAGAVARYLSKPWEKYGSAPTPMEVKQYLVDIGTGEAINLNIGSKSQEASSTPNQMLYMPCNTASAYSCASTCSSSYFLLLLAVSCIIAA